MYWVTQQTTNLLISRLCLELLNVLAIEFKSQDIPPTLTINVMHLMANIAAVSTIFNVFDMMWSRLGADSKPARYKYISYFDVMGPPHPCFVKILRRPIGAIVIANLEPNFCNAILIRKFIKKKTYICTSIWDTWIDIQYNFLFKIIFLKKKQSLSKIRVLLIIKNSP